MLGMLCAAILVADTVGTLQVQQQLSSTDYDVIESWSGTFFALVLARFEPLLIYF